MYDYIQRLIRLEHTARDRYVATANRKYVLAARAMKSKRKQYEQHQFRLAKLHWIDAVWPTSIDTVMQSARDQKLRMLSIDTEVNWNERNNNLLSLREVGLTTYEDGVISAKHYILDDHEKRMTFRYGETIRVTLEDFIPIITAALDRAELIMTFQEQIEVQSFKKFLGIDIPRDKRIDLVFWKARSPGQYYDLMGLANKYGIWHPSAHNAGNDAYVLMLIALSELDMWVVDPLHRYVPKQPKETSHNLPPRHDLPEEQCGS
jgi:hypothetical protein